MKKYLFLLILFASTHLFAADIILLKNSVRIDAKILDVSASEIKYQLLDTLPDLILTQKLNNISSIVFDNGEIYTGTALVNEASSKSKCVLFGVTVGGGFGIRPYYFRATSTADGIYSASIGIDAAWEINDLNALGFYFKAGNAFEDSKLGFRITTGLLGSVGDINNIGSFLYGIGFGYQNIPKNQATFGTWTIPLELRLGGAFKNGFYFTTDIAYNFGYSYGKYLLSIHFGYNFQHIK